MTNWTLASIIFPIAAVISAATPVYACPTSASYRSVVGTAAPEKLPEGAVTIKVRVENALVSYSRYSWGDVQGLNGVVVEPSGNIRAGTSFEIKTRLGGSMCDTWFDEWTEEHEVSDEGVLTGYVSGFVNETERSGTWAIRPLLFQGAKYRDVGAEGKEISGLPARLKVSEDAVWKKVRVNKALDDALPETGELIEKHREKYDR